MKENIKKFLLSKTQDEIEFQMLSTLNKENKESLNGRIAFWNDLVRLYFEPSTPVEPSSMAIASTKPTGSSLFIIRNINELKSEFKIGSVAPICLHQVLAELMDQKILIDYQSASSIDSASGSNLLSIGGTVVNFISGLVFGPATFSPETIPTKLVHVPLLKSCCTAILDHASQSRHYLFDEAGFANAVKVALKVENINAEDLSLITSTLVNQGKLVSKTESGTKIFKLYTSFSTEMEINSVEIGRISLEKVGRDLSTQIDTLQKHVMELRNNSLRQALHGLDGTSISKPRALLILKKIKGLEGILEKRIASLFTVEEILQKIDGAETDEKILQAYQVGSEALSVLLARQDLAKIDETMDNLANVLADQQEIELAIQAGQDAITSGQTIMDEEDLEKELDFLVQEQEKERETKAAASSFTDVDELAAKLENLPRPSQSVPDNSKAVTDKEISTKKNQMIAE